MDNLIKIGAALALLFLVDAPALADGVKTKYKFHSDNEKTLVLMQVTHPKRTDKPHKTDITGYAFRTVKLSDGSFEKQYLTTSSEEQLLLEGEELKNDDRPFHYVLAKGKPGTYVHHATVTKVGVRQWVSCKELGAFIYEFEAGKLNVISTTPGSYVFDGTAFNFEPSALERLKTQTEKRLERFPNITAERVYVTPVNVVTFDNDWNQMNGFAKKCPTPRKNGFKIQDGNSEAADIALGRKPGSAPM